MHTPFAMLKFPRTQHLEGSRLQAGDEDLAQVRFDDLAGRHLVVKEKIDGANAGLRFDATGRVWLQSRGHFLTGGYRERHFDAFKQWAAARAHELFPVLTTRYALYGEWIYAKHTIFYDALPHYFLCFGVYDTLGPHFLDAPRSRELLDGTPVAQVPSLSEGTLASLDDLLALLGRSRYKSDHWQDSLRAETVRWGLDVPTAVRETDPSDLMEGLYITVEEGGSVVERYKWVRHGFLQVVTDSETHWLRRPIVPNRLAPGIDLYGGPP
jgi:hypothetical protein